MSVFESYFGDTDLDQDAADEVRIALSDVGYIGRVRLAIALALTAMALRLVPPELDELSDLISVPEEDGAK